MYWLVAVICGLGFAGCVGVVVSHAQGTYSTTIIGGGGGGQIRHSLSFTCSHRPIGHCQKASLPSVKCNRLLK